MKKQQITITKNGAIIVDWFSVENSELILSLLKKSNEVQTIKLIIGKEVYCG